MSDFTYLFSFIVDIFNYFYYHNNNKIYKKIIKDENKYKECLINYLNYLFQKDINNNKIKSFDKLFKNYDIDERYKFIKSLNPILINNTYNTILGIKSYRHDINIQEVYMKKKSNCYHNERDIFDYIDRFNEFYISIHLNYNIIKNNLNLFECILKLINHFNNNNDVQIIIYYNLDIYKQLKISKNNNLNIKKHFIMFNSDDDNSNDNSNDDSSYNSVDTTDYDCTDYDPTDKDYSDNDSYTSDSDYKIFPYTYSEDECSNQ